MVKGSQPKYGIKVDKNIFVTMSDGVRIALDVYRPDTKGKFPALLGMSAYGKDLQVIPLKTQSKGNNSQLWDGPIEAGDPEYIVPRGYVHVIGDFRGSGDSEGELISGDPRQARDGYEVVEWIAKQPWCDGNVGMLGISAYAMFQIKVAMEQPPHLKAIFPWEPHIEAEPSGVVGSGAWRIFSGRPMDPGGNNGSGMAPRNPVSALMKKLGKEKFEKFQAERLKDPDLIQYSYFWSIARYWFKNPQFADQLLDPYGEILQPKEAELEKIKVPVFTGGPWLAGWAGDVFEIFNRISTPKMVSMGPPWADVRPWRAQNEELIRWMDHWLKGIDTGVLKEPKIKMFVTGSDTYRYENEYPLKNTQWTKFYLHSWNILSPDAPDTAASARDEDEPDCFVQQPLNVTSTVQSVKYTTRPLPKDTTVIGPMAVYWHYALDQDDTCWNIRLRDLDEYGNQTVVCPPQQYDLSDRQWIRASYRTLDKKRSKPYKPWHLNKRELCVPGEIYSNALSLDATSHTFKAGHRIQLEFCSLDVVPGYLHLCSSKTTLHKIYHSAKYPSYLLLPIIPD
jgi:putative CocE/NonD family hydrolase